MTLVRNIPILFAILLVACVVPTGGGGTDPVADGGSTPLCDDHVSCTLDTVVDGVCRHAVNPSACPHGSFCLATRGCVHGKACGSDADCTDSDPCHVNRRCDPSSAICTYTILDRDGDGHPPTVCGGDDCDDDDPARFPGHPETCDGKDNGCTGRVDVGATCGSSYLECLGGACTCKPENLCGGRCTDSDPLNCGACGRACGAGGVCQQGVCQCQQGLTSCNGGCADLTRDPANCGQCGAACGQGALCVGGVCRCGNGGTLCDGACVSLQSDPDHCGQCGVSCGGGKLCVKAQCQLGCDGILGCTNACNDNACFDACVMRGTNYARNLWNSLMNCLVMACPGSLQNDPCFDPNSQTCTNCWSANQMNGGKCRAALTSCQNDL
jgi:Putative metal-binding motif